MPALIFLKRKWLIACDDFVVLSGTEACFRILWFLAALVLSWLKIQNCTESDVINNFLYVIAGDLLLTSFLAIGIAISSGRGSVLEVEKRKCLPKLLYIKLGSIFCDVVFASYGIWLFTQMDGACPVKETFIKITTVIAIIYCAIILIGILVCYDSLGSSKFWDVEVNSHSLNFFKKAQNIWKLRLKLFCCCADISDDNDFIYVEISTSLASFLKGIDLVPTDILAGMVTVSQKHALEKRKNMLVHLPDSSELLEFSSVPDWMTPENAIYFLRVAKSTYGWVAFFDVFQPWNLCLLSSHAKCCMNCCSQGSEDNADNCCYLNLSAVKKITGFTDSDILYTSFRNTLYEPAFYVAVDHNRKFIIIAIRGTRSFSDLMTDLDAENLYFPTEGIHKFRCHRGALRSALFLQKKINELNLLEVAFAENPSYTLAITGHSLGASIASILALLLRPKYPNLQCYSYGPLAVLSALGLKETLDCILAVVVGVDMSPRLTSPACLELREEIIESLRENKTPKFKILAKASCHHFLKRFQTERVRTVREIHDNEIYESDETPNSDEYSTISNDNSLYAPGRILYFERKDCLKPYWLTGLNLQKIIIHPDMLADHQPHRIQNVLELFIKSLNDGEDQTATQIEYC